MDMLFDDDAVGPDDQQPTQGSLAHLRRDPEALFAPGGMLAGRQAQPRGEVAPLAERPGRRGQDRDGGCDQGADAGHRHEPPGHLVLLGAARDLGVELAYLRLQMGEGADQHLQRGDGIGGQPAVRIIDDGDQSRGVGCPLRHDLAELALVPPGAH